MISDAYRPNGPMSLPLRPDLERGMEAELERVYSAPVNGLIVATATGRYGPIRAAQEGERGLTAGDLAIIYDHPTALAAGRSRSRPRSSAFTRAPTW